MHPTRQPAGKGGQEPLPRPPARRHDGAGAAEGFAHSRERCPGRRSSVDPTPSGRCTSTTSRRRLRSRGARTSGTRRTRRARRARRPRRRGSAGERGRHRHPAKGGPPMASRPWRRAGARSSPPRSTTAGPPAGRRCCRHSAGSARPPRAGTTRCTVHHGARSYDAHATCDSCSVTADGVLRPLPLGPSSPARARAASRSAMTWASPSVVVLVPRLRLVVEVSVAQLTDEGGSASAARPISTTIPSASRPLGGRSRRRRTLRRAAPAPARTARRAGCGRSSCGRGRSR